MEHHTNTCDTLMTHVAKGHTRGYSELCEVKVNRGLHPKCEACLAPRRVGAGDDHVRHARLEVVFRAALGCRHERRLRQDSPAGTRVCVCMRARAGAINR